MTKYKPKPMTKGQFKSLETVLEYFTYDEAKHFESEGRPDTGHIYHDLQRLYDYTQQCNVVEKTDA